MAQHDIFRLRFRQGDGASGGWQSGYVPSNPPTSVERIDLREYPAEMVSTAIESAAASAQAGLDITDGPILLTVHFTCAPGTPGRLLVVIHHLAVDAASWRVFLVVLRRSGPRWDPARPLEDHLRIDSIDPWTIRLDGRR